MYVSLKLSKAVECYSCDFEKISDAALYLYTVIKTFMINHINNNKTNNYSKKR